MTEERAPYKLNVEPEPHKLHPAVEEYQKHLEKSCFFTGFADKPLITRNVIIIDCFVEHFLPDAGWKLVKIEDKDRESKG
jgi:hypothetical protein